MEIAYDGKRLEKSLSSEKNMRKEFGAEMARAIMRRIKTLEAAESFEDLKPPMPGKWHHLDSDLKYHWAARLTGNFRIVVFAEDAEEKDCRWDQVVKPRIVGVCDYH